MTDLLPVEPDSLAIEADPVGYMLVVLNRAKSWLQEAQSIDSVREAKAIAVGYESVIREKEMAADAQLAATEIVRRCERRIGELVRIGQEAGEIRKAGEHDIIRNQYVESAPLLDESRSSPSDFYGGSSERTGANVLASVPDEQFEHALDEGRDEGNLSRANIVRKIKGESRREAIGSILTPGHARAERDPIHYRTRRIDAVRVLRETHYALDGLSSGLEVIAGTPLDDDGRQWLDAASASLQTLARRLNTVRRKGGTA